MMLLRDIKGQNNELTMFVAISETYKLRIHFDIVSSKVVHLNSSILYTYIYVKVEKKFRDKTYWLGKSTYSCFLCTASTAESKDKAKILEGFPFNRSLKSI